MPARMIRENLLSSDRFLSLPDNTARMCYVVLLLNADDRGNIEASSGQLVRMWRDFGIDSNAKADSVSTFLADHDLIRFYESDGKRYIHIPRFGQRKRHLQRACPESPWCKNESKQQYDQENDCRKTDERQATVGRPSAEVKRSEEKRRNTQSHFVRPDWVPLNPWTAFEESRQKLRKPLTDRARQLAVAELQRLRDQGHDPVAVIERSVLRGWLTFYPLDEAAGKPGAKASSPFSGAI